MIKRWKTKNNTLEVRKKMLKLCVVTSIFNAELSLSSDCHFYFAVTRWCLLFKSVAGEELSCPCPFKKEHLAKNAPKNNKKCGI